MQTDNKMSTSNYEYVWKFLKENDCANSYNITIGMLCTICGRVMVNAHSAVCGCRFCLDCLTQYLNGDRKYCPSNIDDSCKDEMMSFGETVVIDHSMNQEISRLIVKCPLTGCDYRGELRRMQEHERVCRKQFVNCPYCTVGCQENQLINDKINGHLTDENESHARLLMECVGVLQNEIGSMKKDIAILTEERREREDTAELQATKIRHLDRKIRVVKDENQSMKQQIVSLESEIEHVRGKLGELEQHATNEKALLKKIEQERVLNVPVCSNDGGDSHTIKPNILPPFDSVNRDSSLKFPHNPVFSKSQSANNRFSLPLGFVFRSPNSTIVLDNDRAATGQLTESSTNQIITGSKQMESRTTPEAIFSSHFNLLTTSAPPSLFGCQTQPSTTSSISSSLFSAAATTTGTRYPAQSLFGQPNAVTANTNLFSAGQIPPATTAAVVKPVVATNQTAFLGAFGSNNNNGGFILTRSTASSTIFSDQSPPVFATNLFGTPSNTRVADKSLTTLFGGLNQRSTTSNVTSSLFTMTTCSAGAQSSTQSVFGQPVAVTGGTKLFTGGPKPLATTASVVKPVVTSNQTAFGANSNNGGLILTRSTASSTIFSDQSSPLVATPLVMRTLNDYYSPTVATNLFGAPLNTKGADNSTTTLFGGLNQRSITNNVTSSLFTMVTCSANTQSSAQSLFGQHVSASGGTKLFTGGHISQSTIKDAVTTNQAPFKGVPAIVVATQKMRTWNDHQSLPTTTSLYGAQSNTRTVDKPVSNTLLSHLPSQSGGLTTCVSTSSLGISEPTSFLFPAQTSGVSKEPVSVAISNTIYSSPAVQSANNVLNAFNFAPVSSESAGLEFASTSNCTPRTLKVRRKQGNK